MFTRVFSLLILFLISISTPVADSGKRRQRLFNTPTGDAIPYRIPAITTCSNGDLIAVSDYRYCKSDIGYGAVDLVYRLSHDNGRTWTAEQLLADGNGIEQGNVWQYAFGDCSLVADRTSNEVLAMCVAGKKIYHQGKREDPNRVGCFRSQDNGKTWDKGQELTEQIYQLFDRRTQGPVNSLFFTSGKIHQSRYVKRGKYYRLYAALCTLSGNFVLYSDDFGRQWHVLGDINRSCCSDGDEAKCEELPDGSVVLSSRCEGRMFNIFTYTDAEKARGRWDERVKAPDFNGIANACNGEILIVPAIRRADKARVHVAIQSIPFGPQRTHVGFFYKELTARHYTAEAFSTGWKRGLEVDSSLSAYSTMTLQRDGSIGFLWESGPTLYNIDYQKLSLQQITFGKYLLDRNSIETK